MAPARLPFAGTDEEEHHLTTANQTGRKLLDECRLDPDRPPSGPYRRITDFRVSTTDPDATPLGKGHDGKLGYHDHCVVDGGKARIILAALVTPADVQDNQALLDLLDRVRFRYRLHVRRAVADSKYGTGENPRALEERGIRVCMPVPEYDRTSPFFRQQDFTYDAGTDTYRCPRGTTLTFRLRGLWKVNCEGLLIAAGQNLKRWLMRTGWGRRHGPAGSLALAPPHPRPPSAARCPDRMPRHQPGFFNALQRL